MIPSRRAWNKVLRYVHEDEMVVTFLLIPKILVYLSLAVLGSLN